LKLVRDFLALATGQVLSKIVIFVAFAYLARTLDTETYGFVEFAFALTLFATIVVDLGLGAIGARELVKDPKRAESLTATIPAARILTALVVVPIMGFGAGLMGHNEETVQLVWLFGFSLLALPWKQDWLLQGLEMMRGVALGDVIRAGAFATGVFIFVRGPGDLLAVGFVEIGAAFAAAIFYVGFQQLYVGRVRVRFSIQQIRELASQAWVIGFGHVVWAVNQYVQLILLASLVGGEMTAYYGVAHRVVASLLIFSLIYHFNLFPVLVRVTMGSAERFDQLMQASVRVVAWAGILVALSFTVMSEPILELVFGDRFAAGAASLAILIWVLPITSLSGHARHGLVAKNRQNQLLHAQLIGMAATLLATPFLIWNYGAVGAAIGMVGANLAVWIAADIYARIHVGKIPFFRGSVRPFGLAALIILIWIGVQPGTWLSALLPAAFLVLAPLVDRQLLPDLKRLAHAKSGSVEDDAVSD
jgi:O-antigen/teichoic acid export membrane protein